MKPRKRTRHPSVELPHAIAYMWFGAAITASVLTMYACATMMAIGRRALRPRKK